MWKKNTDLCRVLTYGSLSRASWRGKHSALSGAGLGSTARSWLLLKHKRSGEPWAASRFGTDRWEAERRKRRQRVAGRCRRTSGTTTTPPGTARLWAPLSAGRVGRGRPGEALRAGHAAGPALPSSRPRPSRSFTPAWRRWQRGPWWRRGSGGGAGGCPCCWRPTWATWGWAPPCCRRWSGRPRCRRPSTSSGSTGSCWPTTPACRGPPCSGSSRWARERSSAPAGPALPPTRGARAGRERQQPRLQP